MASHQTLLTERDIQKFLGHIVGFKGETPVTVADILASRWRLGEMGLDGIHGEDEVAPAAILRPVANMASSGPVRMAEELLAAKLPGGMKLHDVLADYEIDGVPCPDPMQTASEIVQGTFQRTQALQGDMEKENADWYVVLMKRLTPLRAMFLIMLLLITPPPLSIITDTLILIFVGLFWLKALQDRSIIQDEETRGRALGASVVLLLIVGLF